MMNGNLALTLRRAGAATAAAAILFAAGQASAQSAQQVVPIWPGAAPGTESWTGDEVTEKAANPTGAVTERVVNVTKPTLTVFKPAAGKANGAAVVIAPGGGFQLLAWEAEGTDIGKWFAERGVTAFVLKYRVKRNPAVPMGGGLANFESRRVAMKPFQDFAVADGVQALRHVRANAAKYGVAPDRIGVVGFSAGAMVATSVAMETDPATQPNFAASIYGAIVREGPVPANAPPIFLAAAQDDGSVPVAKSVETFTAWSAAKREAELHIYEKGGHAFALRKRGLPVDNWTTPFEAWLTAKGVLPKP